MPFNAKHIGCMIMNIDDMEKQAMQIQLNAVHTWLVAKSLFTVNVT